MAVFPLRFRDTRPSLVVPLFNGDGTPLDLTTHVSLKLHVHLLPGTGMSPVVPPSDLLFAAPAGSIFTREMLPVEPPTLGFLQYDWVDADWIATPGPALVMGKHRMVYEVILAGGVRLTFPIPDDDGLNAYDILHIGWDVGQG